MGLDDFKKTVESGHLEDACYILVQSLQCHFVSVGFHHFLDEKEIAQSR